LKVLWLNGFFPTLKFSVFEFSGLSRLNGGEETFLLVTAALANLTFMSSLAASAMKQYKTAQALVNVVRSTMDQRTLFSKDQVYISFALIIYSSQGKLALFYFRW